MKSSFSDIVNSEKPVLVDFSAEWCGPCKMMAPILSDLKKKVGDRATILKLDVDKNPDVAARFKIQSVPTLIVFQKGAVKWRQSGVLSAQQLENALFNH